MSDFNSFIHIPVYKMSVCFFIYLRIFIHMGISDLTTYISVCVYVSVSVVLDLYSHCLVIRLQI